MGKILRGCDVGQQIGKWNAGIINTINASGANIKRNRSLAKITSEMNRNRILSLLYSGWQNRVETPNRKKTISAKHGRF